MIQVSKTAILSIIALLLVFGTEYFYREGLFQKSIIEIENMQKKTRIKGTFDLISQST